MDKTSNTTTDEKETSQSSQHEDVALKTCMQFFADELLPFLGIYEPVKAFAPTELVHLDISKMFQDFNFVMEDGSWKHFEFQSTNEGLKGLKRFRVYESMTSYQHKVPVTTYVLFSGSIKNPMTKFSEGINTYQIVPIIMVSHNADEYISNLENKVKSGEPLTKEDLVPLTLCSLMSGNMSQAERIKAAYKITDAATDIDAETLRRLEAMIYAMADKFLDSDELRQLRKELAMTRLGKMLVEQGIEQNKLEVAKNLLNLLTEDVIAERIGLPLETVQQLKAESTTKE